MKKLLLLLFLALPLSLIAQEPLDFDQVRADEIFREGVEAFQSGFYNKSILAFESSLQLKPETPLTRYWLGFALYYSGFVEAALGEWETILRSQTGFPQLDAFVRIIQNRRGVISELAPQDRMLSLFAIEGTELDEENVPLFLRPTSVRPLDDGSYLIAAFGTEDVIHINANGFIVDRFIGGIGGFEGPYDILPTEEGFWVSEFTADRVSRVNSLGLKDLSLGGNGRGEGQLLGPQYLTMDSEGFLYVSDWGNRRIRKFTQEGEYVLSFGDPRPGFPGLQEPTGVVFHEGMIYVSDSMEGSIVGFDTSGNFVQNLLEGFLDSPEGLFIKNEELLISDAMGVRSLDLNTGEIATVLESEDLGSRVLMAARDINENILIAKFDSSKVESYSEASRLISGLHVEILRVYSRDFPEVYVDVQVEDWMGVPLVGLQGNNFVIQESGSPVGPIELDYQGFQDQEMNISVIVPKGNSFSSQNIRRSLETFRQGLQDQTRWSLYATDQIPVQLHGPQTTFLQRVELMEGLSKEIPIGGLDQTLRFASGEMIGSLDRSAIVYLSSGEIHPDDFSSYDTVKTLQYLTGNRIPFYTIVMGDHEPSSEILFLTEGSGGEVFYLTDPEGFMGIFEHIRSAPSGRYILKFEAVTPPEFGRRYIPLNVEVNYFRQSGRGNLGYFPPLSLDPTL